MHQSLLDTLSSSRVQASGLNTSMYRRRTLMKFIVCTSHDCSDTTPLLVLLVWYSKAVHLLLLLLLQLLIVLQSQYAVSVTTTFTTYAATLVVSSH
jgi:hypothetical protein